MRRKDREITDQEEIIELLEKNKVCHLAMVDQQQPYVVPLNYGYCFENDRLVLYIHSATIGRKIEVLKDNPHVCIEISQEDGLVGTGNIACQYGYYFKSLIGEGKVEFIHEKGDKEQGLSLLMKHLTGRNDFVYNQQSVEHVVVIKIIIDHFSVKGRVK